MLDLTTGATRRLPQDDGRFCGSGAAFAWTGTTILAWGGDDCRDTSGPQTINRGISASVQVLPT